MKLYGEAKSKFLQEVQNARPFATLLRNDGALLKAKESISFTISKSIVEVVIHQLLLEFDSDEDEADEMKFLKMKKGYNITKYRGPILFELIVSYVSVGVSFR